MLVSLRLWIALGVHVGVSLRLWIALGVHVGVSLRLWIALGVRVGWSEAFDCTGRSCGALVETTPFDRRVVGSPCRDFGQVPHLQLPVALRRVNSDKVSIAVVGSASERLMM